MACGSYSSLDRPLNGVGPGFSNGTSEDAGCRIVAIIVTFHPSRRKLEQLLQAVRSQAQGVVIVDNTPAGGADPGDFSSTDDPVAVIRNGRNVGLAAAQNQGI